VHAVCNALNFESLDQFISGMQVQLRLQNDEVKFVHQGHRVKVKVTGAKIVFVCHDGLKGNLVTAILNLG